MSFSIKMDLSDAKVRTGGLAEVEPGVYEGKTTECETYKDGKSVKFTVDLGAAGECEIYIGTDVTKAGNRNGWLTALASHGKNVDKIKAAKGDFAATPQFFVGQKCFVIVRAVEGVDEQGRPKLNDKSFLPPDRYAALKNVKPTARKADAPAANGTAPASTQAPAQPAGTPAPNLFD